MRTKIGKRIGPVPITLVAVFALAAFISTGLLIAVSGGQTAEAQSSTCTIDSMGMSANSLRVMSGDMCDVAGDSATIRVEGVQPASNGDPGGAQTAWVYAKDGMIEGGQSLTAYEPGISGDADDPPDPVVYSVIKLSIPAGTASISGDDTKAATASLTITPDAGESMVTLLVYYQAQPASLSDFDADLVGTDEPDQQLEGADGSVPVYFLGAPVKMTKVDNVDTERSQISVSHITEPETDADSSPTLTASVLPENAPLVSDTETAYVSAIFQDKNGRPISGNITFAIGTPSAGAEDVQFDGGGPVTRSTYGKSFGYVNITDVPTDIAVNIPVTATLESSLGMLTLEGKLVRKTRVTSVSVGTYSCGKPTYVIVDQDDRTATDSQMDDVTVNCENAYKATKDLTEKTVFAPDDYILVVGVAKDSADNVRDVNISIDEDVPTDGDDVIEPNDTATQVTAGMVGVKEEMVEDDDAEELNNARQILQIKGINDAALGSYTIEGSVGRVTVTTDITITGDATMISVECTPDPIPTSTGQTNCVAMVADPMGNVPSNLDTEAVLTPERDTILVAVRDKDAQVIGAVSNRANINSKGVATFSVLLGQDFKEGRSVTINVSTTILDNGAALQASTTVVYGDAPSEPGMPMNVMAEATSDTMITVTWDAVMDATSYMVERGYMDADNMMMWMTVAEMTTDMMYMDSGLMAETAYYYRVTAMNDAGYGDASDGTAMATTMMMGEMPLGMPMNVMAEATSDTMITVTWDAVMDATSYMVERGYMNDMGEMMWMTVAEMTMDMMYMDSGLMAETTYYYRVTAMNDAGSGDASDGTAMATTMMATTMMDELGTATGIGVGFNRGGALQVYWTKAANAMGYIIVAIDTADSTVGGDPVVLNDGDAETRNISGLTPGATYDIYVIATGSGGAFELGEPYRETAK